MNIYNFTYQIYPTRIIADGNSLQVNVYNPDMPGSSQVTTLTKPDHIDGTDQQAVTDYVTSAELFIKFFARVPLHFDPATFPPNE